MARGSGAGPASFPERKVACSTLSAGGASPPPCWEPRPVGRSRAPRTARRGATAGVVPRPGASPGSGRRRGRRPRPPPGAGSSDSARASGWIGVSSYCRPLAGPCSSVASVGCRSDPSRAPAGLPSGFHAGPHLDKHGAPARTLKAAVPEKPDPATGRARTTVAEGGSVGGGPAPAGTVRRPQAPVIPGARPSQRSPVSCESMKWATSAREMRGSQPTSRSSATR